VEPTSIAPEVVSHYRILRRLGAGGMGEVYLATDITLGRSVAIKFLAQGDDAEASGRRRLLREAQAAAALDHPNICAVHEIGSEDGRSFIVMQYCEGETLAARLRHGPLPLATALDLVAQVSDALAFAHRHGIVHRDVKPQNVIIGPEGRVKVLDFGLAKPIWPSTDGTAGLTQTQLTTDGSPVGTAAYMAPEQIRCGPVDGRTDLFSTGVLLYECLAGQRPFTGASTYEILEGICHREPAAPSSMDPRIPAEVDTLTLQMLAKSPGDRPERAEHVRDALRQVLGQASGQHTPSSRSRLPSPPANRFTERQRRGAVAVGVGLAVFVLLAGASYWRGRPQPLPPPSADAARWYDLGVAALGDGAYQQASRALETAVQVDPEFPLAYARLAEAHAELDEMDLASRALLTVTQLVPDRSRLLEWDRLYLNAITAMVQRQGPEAAEAYTRLARLQPGDPRLLVDLGRAYEIVPDPAKAEESYAAALAIDPQFAAPYLRRGVLRGQRQDADGALADFAAAERFYRAASAIENETEVHLQRGAFFRQVMRLADSHRELQRARELSSAAGHPHHQVRALQGLALTTLFEGRFTEAQKLASEAIGLSSGMHGARVNSVIELGNINAATGRYAQAEKDFRQAMELAARLRAPRGEARARLSLASTLVTLADAPRLEEGQRLAQEALAYYRRYHFVRESSQALAVLGRAADIRGDLDQADRAFMELLALGRSLGNEGLVAEALDGLSTSQGRRGALVVSLTHLEEGLAGFERLGNTLALTWGRMRRMDLLAQLGRRAEAEEQLAQLDETAAKAGPAFAALKPWLEVLHARLALTVGSHATAARHACAVEKASFDDESWRVEMWSLCATARARQGRAAEATRAIEEALRREASLDPITRAGLLAIEAEVHGREGRLPEAAEAGRRALAVYAPSGNDEAQWRVCALLATMPGDAGERAGDEFASCAQAALARLRGQWGQAALGSYLARADMRELERSVRLASTSS
jgi:tetratricopeptide (TPR) repeat protein